MTYYMYHYYESLIFLGANTNRETVLMYNTYRYSLDWICGVNALVYLQAVLWVVW